MKLLPLSKKPSAPTPPEKTRNKRQRLPKIPVKPIVYSTLALAAVGFVVWAFRPQPIAVDTLSIRRGELLFSVNAEGKTRVRDRFVVSAPVDGRLGRVELDAGDKVEQGTIVARIDPLPHSSAVKEALGRLAELRSQRQGVATQRPKAASLEQARQRITAAILSQNQAQTRVIQAEAALSLAQRDKQRAQELYAAGAISRQDREVAQLNQTTKAKELEAARLAVKSATSEVEIAQSALTVLQQEQKDPDYLLRVYDARIASTEAELAKLRDEASRTDIRSPVSGQVLRVQQKSAQFVTSGTPILEIADVSRLEIVIDVLSSDATKIKRGDEIHINQGTDTQPIKAKVKRIEPAAFTKVSALGVEEQRVNIIGEFVDSSPAFGDAYRLDLQIIVWNGKNVLKVPLNALFRCGKSWCTFVVKDGIAKRRQVEVGHRSDFEAEVLQGLQAGEIVILHPTEQIDDGKSVLDNSAHQKCC
ncbi:MAG: efflux RND transporter periplasmic adaptor subunit [Nostocaceae cyanobacterium]|nr:efflux RND transporter periplasmic adaptor subunit [Nostocaceae cyanobacterium]